MSWKIEVKDVPASQLLVELHAKREEARDKFTDAECEQQNALFLAVGELAMRYGGCQDITLSGHVSREGAHKYSLEGIVLLDDDEAAERESRLGEVVSRDEATDGAGKPLFPEEAAKPTPKRAKKGS